MRTTSSTGVTHAVPPPVPRAPAAP